MKGLDCCPYSRFLHTSSSKAATNFMAVRNEISGLAQVISIHRCACFHKLNSFKPAKHLVVSEMYINSFLGLEEEEKFLRVIEKCDWPDEMQNFKHNMLKCRVLDQELTGNQINDDTVLSSLLEAFQRHYPMLVDEVRESQESKNPASTSQTVRDADKAASEEPCSSDLGVGDTFMRRENRNFSQTAGDGAPFIFKAQTERTKPDC